MEVVRETFGMPPIRPPPFLDAPLFSCAGSSSPFWTLNLSHRRFHMCHEVTRLPADEFRDSRKNQPRMGGVNRATSGRTFQPPGYTVPDHRLPSGHLI